jgi:predicted peptidase
MSLIKLTFFTAMALAFSTEQSLSAANLKQTKESYTAEVTKKYSYHYLKYLPEGYDGKKPFPLLLFLHGAGNEGVILKK